MKRLALLSWVPFLLPPLAGCGDKNDPAASGETSGTTSDDTETGTGTDSADSTGGEETAAPELVPVHAKGIRITKVDANQGVSVPLAENGQWVDGASRNAHLVQNRRLLVRALFELDDDFQPRELVPELTITYADGTTEVAKKPPQLVQFPSIETNVDTSFWWLLDEPRVQPGIKFQVQIWEKDPGDPMEAPPDPLPVSPLDGPKLVGVEDSYMVLRVTLVPVQHDIGDTCPAAPVVDENAKKVFGDQLYMHNPVDLVEITVREPYVYAGAMTSFNGLLSALSQLRFSDGADPGEYYYGLVRPCDGGPDGVGGQAIDIPGPPSKGNSASRTAVGRWYTSNVLGSAGTFVHEIGHTQGRRHVACSGDEGGPDPSYPYDGGGIGVFGFGVLDFSSHSDVSSKDFMTYCGNAWVSDWGWEKVFPYIKEISSWDMRTPTPPEDDRLLLIGLFDERTGTETWFTVPGSLSGRPPSPGESLEIEDGGQRLSVPLRRGEMSHDGHNVMVELPPGFDPQRAASLTLVTPSGRKSIDPSRIEIMNR